MSPSCISGTGNPGSPTASVGTRTVEKRYTNLGLDHWGIGMMTPALQNRPGSVSNEVTVVSTVNERVQNGTVVRMFILMLNVMILYSHCQRLVKDRNPQ